MNARLASTLPLVFAIAVSLAGCEWHVHDEPYGSASATPSDPSTSPSGGGQSTPSGPSATPAPSCGVKIDRWKELLVINRSVLSDRRAKNDVDGAAWSFRTRLEELAGGTTDGPGLAQAWLTEWMTRSSLGQDAAPVVPRSSIDDVILTPWRQSLTAPSSYGQSTPLPLDSAPFRLIAIANRLDLRERDLGCDGASGELRFIYTAVDPATHLALPLSVIVEIPYPSSKSPREWAARWHDVASHPFGAEYNDALAALTTEISSTATRSSIRVRTNEVALGAKLGLPWELREFALDTTQGAARLIGVPLAKTPRIELARSPSLDAWAEDNAATVLAGTYVLPGGLQAGSAPMAQSFFRWESISLQEDLRHALSIATCNGCHGGERPADLLRFQHIAPGDSAPGYYTTTNGETQVSRFLNDPSGGDDELGRRATSVAHMLCSECSTPTTAPPYTP